ncbi:hypothetical protein [Jeotgalicoccus sp. WY2]|uniref:hypothetical protein n=1 Tax=Jeotgalicoccus sp. WY2 TaxID=2708346 RepID=UPI001BD43115|nr:hypothetical protein [Jeotgalicoccus sp. WY2]
MTVLLMLLLTLSMYPIVKIIFYMPISALLKNNQNRKSLSLILTAVMTAILFIILLVLAYTTMGYTLTNDKSIFDSGPEFYSFIGFTYVLGLFAAVVLLVLKFINRKSSEPLEAADTDSKALIEDKQNKLSGFENIILTLVIAGFAGFILFIFYIV